MRFRAMLRRLWFLPKTRDPENNQANHTQTDGDPSHIRAGWSAWREYRDEQAGTRKENESILCYAAAVHFPIIAQTTGPRNVSAAVVLQARVCVRFAAGEREQRPIGRVALGRDIPG